MTAPAEFSAGTMGNGELLRRMPKVRGRLAADVPIGPMTWFRVGGPAEVLFRPADRDDLAGFMAALPDDIPVTVIGVGSNLLVRDGGIPGVTVRLTRDLARVVLDGDEIVAGCGALDLNVSLTAAEAGLTGLEFLSGIPGTIGGAFPTNAGAYGGELKDALVEAEAVDRAGNIHRLDPLVLGFSYRHSEIPGDWIFTRARLRGTPGDAAAIDARMAEIKASREASQPVRARTGGSTFANPPGHHAWELVDKVGGRGLVRGGAMVSEKHTNFLINNGDATAAEIEALAEEVRRRVHEQFGVALQWEIRRIGVMPSGVPAIASGAPDAGPEAWPWPH